MMTQLKKLLENSKHTIAFTGAGVSTLSGIRDFRGKGGFYTSDYNGFQVEDLLSLPLFVKDPSYFYKWAGEFVYVLDSFEPSVVHRVLATMEQKGLLHSLYTQNIDLLHTKAGSKKVYELHGSPKSHYCMNCKTTASYEEVEPLVQQGKMPTCESCGKVMKPDIIFYGENLNQQLLQQADQDFSKADLVLALGSSLTVQPVASLPMVTVYQGGHLVIVNAQKTPLDSYATLTFNDLENTFTELESWLI
ncbi:MAG: NAD-dependent protein deacylase [Sphaerochaetaceae bacterium]|jgi:NAD-dependent deacetylase